MGLLHWAAHLEDVQQLLQRGCHRERRGMLVPWWSGMKSARCKLPSAGRLAVKVNKRFITCRNATAAVQLQEQLLHLESFH